MAGNAVTMGGACFTEKEDYRMTAYPCIDVQETGRRIRVFRERKGLSVMDVARYMGFENPQAVYHWQSGKALPSLDNMYALSILLEITINDIIADSREADEASFLLNYRFNYKLMKMWYIFLKTGN